MEIYESPFVLSNCLDYVLDHQNNLSGDLDTGYLHSNDVGGLTSIQDYLSDCYLNVYTFCLILNIYFQSGYLDSL